MLRAESSNPPVSVLKLVFSNFQSVCFGLELISSLISLFLLNIVRAIKYAKGTRAVVAELVSVLFFNACLNILLTGQGLESPYHITIYWNFSFTLQCTCA